MSHDSGKFALFNSSGSIISSNSAAAKIKFSTDDVAAFTQLIGTNYSNATINIRKNPDVAIQVANYQVTNVQTSGTFNTTTEISVTNISTSSFSFSNLDECDVVFVFAGGGLSLTNTTTQDFELVTVDIDEDVHSRVIGDFPAVDPADFSLSSPNNTIPNAVATGAQGTAKFNFLVHDEEHNKQNKLTFDDLAGALAIDLINQNIANGFGTVSSYTSSGSSVLGDFNGDGGVGSADLLEFLLSYGNSTVFQDTTAQVTASFNPSGFSVQEIGFTASSIAAGGTFSCSVNNTTGVIEFTDGAASGTTPAVELNAVPLKLRVPEQSIQIVTATAARNLTVSLELKTLNQADSVLSTTTHTLFTDVTSVDDGQQQAIIPTTLNMQSFEVDIPNSTAVTLKKIQVKIRLQDGYDNIDTFGTSGSSMNVILFKPQ